MQGLTGLIDQYQTKKTDLNTQHYLDKLEAYTDPEALQQARVNGDIAKLKESYGRYIDHKAVRGADESRINSLQELAKGHQEHSDRLQEVAERQTVNQIQTLIAKGDLAGANKLMSENPNLLKTAALAKYFGERDQWGKEFGLKEKDTNANVAYKNAQTQTSLFNLGQLKQQAELEEQARGMRNAIAKAAFGIGQDHEYTQQAISNLIKENPQMGNFIKVSPDGSFDIQASLESLQGIINNSGDVTENDIQVTEEDIKKIEQTIPIPSAYPQRTLQSIAPDTPTSQTNNVSSTTLDIFPDMPQPSQEASVPNLNQQPKLTPVEREAIYNAEKEKAIQALKSMRAKEVNEARKGNRTTAQAQLDYLRKFVKENGLDSKKTATAAVNALRESFLKQGYDAGTVDSAFDNVDPKKFYLKDYGKEAINKEIFDKQKEYEENTQIANSKFGDLNTPLKERNAEITSTVNSRFKDSDEIAEITRIAHSISNKGINLEGKHYYIPHSMLINAINGVKSNFFGNYKEESFREYLAEHVRNNKNLMKELEEYTKFYNNVKRERFVKK